MCENNRQKTSSTLKGPTSGFFAFDLAFLKQVVNLAPVFPRPLDPGYEATAVFMLIFNKNSSPHILAVLKADKQGYPWANQVALPGGHVDKTDATSLDAAYRELKEEVGIDRRQVELAGSLGHFQTIQNKDIEVFLGILNSRERALPYDPKEISEVLEIPIPDLLTVHLSKNSHGRVPGVFELIYPLKRVVVWGVTARIFHYFFERLIDAGVNPSGCAV